MCTKFNKANIWQSISIFSKFITSLISQNYKCFPFPLQYPIGPVVFRPNVLVDGVMVIHFFEINKKAIAKDAPYKSSVVS